jgi:hypothetical protein
MESPLVVAQRAAIQEARARYERGGIAVDTLKNALDAITAAPDVGSVEAVIAGLPAASSSALAAFDPTPPAPAIKRGGRVFARIGAFMSPWRRSRPWTLAPQSHVNSMMGDVLVDLRLANLPAQGHISVNVTMGKAHILIPRGVRVWARLRVIMGEATTLGEKISGLIVSDEVDHEPTGGVAASELEIDATVIMGEMKLLLVDPISAGASSTQDIATLATDVLREALLSARDHLAQSRAQRAALPGGRE